MEIIDITLHPRLDQHPYAFILDSNNEIQKVKFEYESGRQEIKIGSFSHKLKIALDLKDELKVSILKVSNVQYTSDQLDSETPGGTPSGETINGAEVIS